MKDCYLKKNSEFQRVYSNKKISGSRYITLFTAKNNRDYPRFGITATKKVGNAVNRNFIRRRLKHLLRENSHTVSYTHLTLPTIAAECRSRWSPYH